MPSLLKRCHGLLISILDACRVADRSFQLETHQSKMLGSPVSMGIMASTPYVIEIGVSPIEHRGVVLYAYNTIGSSSVRRPFESSSLLFKPFIIDLLVASA